VASLRRGPGKGLLGRNADARHLHLAPTADGTRLTVTEAGFEKIPPERRDEAFRMNDEGWGIQMENIREYLEENP
jgi:hypothetical protein